MPFTPSDPTEFCHDHRHSPDDQSTLWNHVIACPSHSTPGRSRDALRHLARDVLDGADQTGGKQEQINDEPNPHEQREEWKGRKDTAQHVSSFG
jgi:hypothetical protein